MPCEKRSDGVNRLSAKHAIETLAVPVDMVPSYMVRWPLACWELPPSGLMSSVNSRHGKAFVARHGGSRHDVLAVSAVVAEGPLASVYICVAPTARRRGFGGRLFRLILDDLRSGNVEEIVVRGLDSRNLAGVSFVTSLGFCPDSEQRVRMSVLLGSPDLAAPAVEPGYGFRCYQEGDAENWVRVVNSAFSGTAGFRRWTTDGFHSWFDSSPLYSRERMVFLCYEGTPVATATAWEGSEANTAVGLVHWVAADPGFQGRGLGRAVTLRCLSILRDEGWSAAWLWTRDDYTAAVSLYTKLGFVEMYRSLSYRMCLHRDPVVARCVGSVGLPAERREEE